VAQSSSTIHDLRLDAYEHLQELELAYFEERSTGRLISIGDDINQLEQFLDVGANDLIQVSTTVVVVGRLLYSGSSVWMAMLLIPFILWGSIAFQRLLAPRYAAVREQVSLLNSRLANNLTGITTIKSFTAENMKQRVWQLKVRLIGKTAVRSSSVLPLYP